MKSGWWNLMIILFIFTFGALFGIETAKDGIRQTGAIPGEPQKPYYVTRIEDGKMIVAPVHSEGNGSSANHAAARSDLEGTDQVEKVAQPSGKSNSEQSDHPHPVLSQQSPLGDLGFRIGEKVSEWTRKLLKSSLSLIFE